MEYNLLKFHQFVNFFFIIMNIINYKIILRVKDDNFIFLEFLNIILIIEYF